MIIHNLPMADYLAHPALGSSNLKMILNSPADFKANLARKKKETKATSLGTAIHTAVLEPDHFDARYAVQSEDWGPRNKGTGYQLWRDFKIQNQDKEIIAYEDSVLIARIRKAAVNHTSLQKIIKGARIETTAISADGKRKARADVLASDGFIWDLKSSSMGITDSDISKTIYKMGYHFSAVHHMDVYSDFEEINGFGWIFVSTDTPAVHIVTRKASETLLRAGKKDHDYALKLLDDCNTTGKWWGYDDEITEIDLPMWVESTDV